MLGRGCAAARLCKGNILNLPQPGSASSMVGRITPADLMKTIRSKPHA